LVKTEEIPRPLKQVQELKEISIRRKKVVVAGASGLIGVAALEAFLSAGWEVVAISRRKPVLPSGRNFEFISVDLRDRPQIGRNGRVGF
jgi:nucleoside-diphosphate-sugar epimerase